MKIAQEVLSFDVARLLNRRFLAFRVCQIRFRGWQLECFAAAPAVEVEVYLDATAARFYAGLCQTGIWHVEWRKTTRPKVHESLAV